MVRNLFLDLFFSTFTGGKKVYADHPIVQVLMVDIFDDLKSLVQAQPQTLGNVQGGFVPFGGPVPSTTGARPTTRAAATPITSDMLSRALSAASGQAAQANNQASSTGGTFSYTKTEYD